MTWACVFPGQGSQSVGMSDDLLNHQEDVQRTFEEASDTLHYNMQVLVQTDPNHQLADTEYTQPALLTTCVAIWRRLIHFSAFRPTYLAGHSLGEYTALVAAEILSFADALLLVQQRGRLMQQAVPAGIGAMAAVLGLEDNALIMEICQKMAQGQVVAPVNFNAIGQTVIAGHKEAVLRAMAALQEAGAKRVLLLPVSVPSHCVLMKDAARLLGQFMQELTWHTPRIPIIHNVDVASHTSPAEIQSVLQQQLYSPVRWVDTIQYLSADGVDTLLELGPGKVLCGLNKRIVPAMMALPAFNEETLQSVLEIIT